MSAHILLVEDEQNVANVVIINLEAESFEVSHASDLQSARTLISENIQLIILDVMLPDGDGTEFATELREQGVRTPILMLTAKGATDDIVTGLQAGADDYLCKPFKLDELLGRIHAQLRRSQWQQPDPAVEAATEIQFDHCTVDLRSGRVNQVNDDLVQLTDIELKLLRYFHDRPYENLTREEIMETVWDLPATAKSRTLDNFIVRFRKLFELDHKAPQHFLTVYGSGYRYLPPGDKS